MRLRALDILEHFHSALILRNVYAGSVSLPLHSCHCTHPTCSNILIIVDVCSADMHIHVTCALTDGRA